MPKQAERDYLKKIGSSAVRYALDKPFSDADCGRYLIQLGAIMSLLPRPPARLLDLGCGTGWTSVFFAKRGYEVVGLDIAADMVRHGRARADSQDLPNLRFQIGDYEEMEFCEEFEAVVFFASLHHAVDERQALRRAFQALKPQGVCVTCEPGQGHAQTAAAREATQRYGVTEKDMPPARIIELARKAGFRRCRVVPDPLDCAAVFGGVPSANPQFGIRRLLETWAWGRRLLWLRRLWRFRSESAYRSGIVALEKDSLWRPSS
jgi:SAM-dependent methyltransferase